MIMAKRKKKSKMVSFDKQFLGFELLCLYHFELNIGMRSNSDIREFLLVYGLDF